MKTLEQHPSKFKAVLKDLLPAYIIAFVFCFMLFVYEPLVMYSTNQLDFWFDMALMIGPVLLAFLIFFASSVLLLTAAYFVNKAFAKEKEPLVYRIITIVFFWVFFVTYLQGNMLAGGLPALDGSTIDWDAFRSKDIITLAVGVFGLAAVDFMLIKLGAKKTLKYAAGVSVVIFGILFVTLVYELISWNSFARKDSIIATNENFNTISSDKNFVVLLNDAVGSSEFNSVLEENPEYKEVFEDFTYYPDTLGCFPCTRDTIPVVLGGALNKNEMKFEKFSSKALNESPLFKELTERDYDINLYESELVWYGSKNFSISNSTDYKNYRLPFKSFFSEEVKYIKYKYLPYYLKRYSDIESMDFNGLVDKYLWDDHTIYKTVTKKTELDKQSDKMFSFVHTEGAHIPFSYDKDLNILPYNSGTYEQKIEATIKMVDAYIDRLKANDAYENTVIIVMADHGNTNLNSADDMLVRANPMFMIKGIGEHHKFAKSDKPLSYLDLMDIYSKLLDGKTAEEATEDIPDKRERYFMWYRNFRLEDHIEEYVVTDKAWEWTKFKKTGREYDL